MSRTITPEKQAFINAIVSTLKRWMGEHSEHNRPAVRGADEPLRWIDFYCSTRLPAMSVERYVTRLVCYMRCSDETIVIGMCLLKRIIEREHRGVQTGTVFSIWTLHRMLLAAFVIAAKVHEDVYYTMSYYAGSGGVTLAELRTMESLFLFNKEGLEGAAMVSRHEYLSVLHKEILRQDPMTMPAMKQVPHIHHTAGHSATGGAAVAHIPNWVWQLGLYSGASNEVATP